MIMQWNPIDWEDVGIDWGIEGVLRREMQKIEDCANGESES